MSLTVSFSLDMSTMPKSPFTDVVAGSWYFDAALYASSHNLMLGTSPTEFSPNITMTRGMLVTVLYRMNGSPSVSGKTPFTDVRTDKWYSAAVLWAYQNSIVTGMSDTTFAPINNVTREQMATILFRYTKTAAPDKAKASEGASLLTRAATRGRSVIAGITLACSRAAMPPARRPPPSSPGTTHSKRRRKHQLSVVVGIVRGDMTSSAAMFIG